MNWFKNSVVISLAGLAFNAQAQLGETPIIGGIFNSSEILKNQITSSLTYSTKFAKDITLFTIGGMTLEAYLLTLPLDSDTKLRVMAQLADPTYSIPLGYFLYQFYDRYTGLDNSDQFKAHLTKIYEKQQLLSFEHSLFQIQNQQPLEKKHAKDQAHPEGLKIDSEFIAAMVTVYDALFQIGEWQDMEQLPKQYTYLTQSADDLSLVARIQPIVIEIIKQASVGMENGEMKNALLAIVQDGQPQNRNKPNNKAQALTITLIDFIRLNVLKGYRQFVYQDEREEKLTQWLQSTLDNNPQEVIDFLNSQQHRRLAVQIIVDGLQQGLVEGLIDPKKPFLSEVYRRHINAKDYFSPVTDSSPEHQQSLTFLKTLLTGDYQDPNYLPFFKRIYRDHVKSIARTGISSTPTISVRNLPIVKTGAKVSGQNGTRIPNFHFVDRQQDRAYYFFGNDALQLDRLIQDNGVQTMFDRLVHLKTLNCNAQYDWNAHTSYDGLINLGAGETLRDFGEKRCLRELEHRANVERSLNTMRQDLIDNIQAYKSMPIWDFFTKISRKWKLKQDLANYAGLDIQGMPDFTLIYNPWPDHFAHFVGPFSDEILMPTGELNRLDYWIRQIENTYQNAGVYKRTLWGMAGDHGLTPVYYTLNPEKTIFQPLETRLGYPLKIKKISSDEGEGPKITNALNYPSNKDIDVIVASTAGGNFMMDLFNSQSGWSNQPTYQDLVNWSPINAQNNQVLDIISETVNALSDTLDYLVVRESKCDQNYCEARIVGSREGKRHDEIIIHDRGRYFYGSAQPSNLSLRLLDVQSLNPFLAKPTEKQLNTFASLIDRCVLRPKRDNSETWCSSTQWRTLTRFTPRPDSVVQLAKLYEEDRAGTINLFPSEGIGFNTKVPGRHAGEAYLEKDAFIGFWGEPIGTSAKTLSFEANGSLAPTIYEYLTGENVQQGDNGWGFPSLLEKLDISPQ
ncbi:alkaline phosphatase family protein [Vibrio caribbeanicus]|uniref:Nucleotide pyrophosphatase n=1 Tax=Vibrio caribbeanicus ATCC BAA-2122 TaxID=796620 RepID=E3BMA1_9VIBR|nr:alkaline phosphatase family protein [Vibrio caribbeanicus]EFP95813.1 hypothetical protein VIBC2010_14079 [Vibrio caribbeanicus ATCC BAA-2122]